MATFPGEAGLAGFIASKDDGNGGDYWSCKMCKAPVKSSPTNQHCFLQAGGLFLRQTKPKKNESPKKKRKTSGDFGA